MRTLDLIAAICSIVGLFLTVWTLIVANSARKAAEEAREATLRSSAAADLGLLARLAQEFLSALQDERIPEAILRGRDLMSGISTARRRWNKFFDDSGRLGLDEASKQIEIASRVLAVEGAPTELKRRDKLLRIAGGVLTTLGSESGKIDSTVQGAKR